MFPKKCFLHLFFSWSFFGKSETTPKNKNPVVLPPCDLFISEKGAGEWHGCGFLEVWCYIIHGYKGTTHMIYLRVQIFNFREICSLCDTFLYLRSPQKQASKELLTWRPSPSFTCGASVTSFTSRLNNVCHLRFFLFFLLFLLLVESKSGEVEESNWEAGEGCGGRGSLRA